MLLNKGWSDHSYFKKKRNIHFKYIHTHICVYIYVDREREGGEREREGYRWIEL